MEIKTVRQLDAEIRRKREILQTLSYCSGMESICERKKRELGELETQKQSAKETLVELISKNVPESKEAQVLILRFVGLEKISSIADKMNMTERYIGKLCKSGLLQYNKAIGDSEIV